ncbi:MAG: class I SAM-dependent methyltransferase [Balneolales bacterium]|nr:class I SAM-dependent methyltransferase [Balneolales bacterium]
MNVEQAYNKWAEQYDTNINPTRDLEIKSLRNALTDLSFSHCLEVGCGTGKNTEWLLSKSEKVLAVDLSDEMLKKARQKISDEHVIFKKADINENWSFTSDCFDLVVFSLVLEHVSDLHHVFKQLHSKVDSGGYVYIGELHPFKQYRGSKARFEVEGKQQEVPCFTHHVSDFTNLARDYGFQIVILNEHFDHDDRTEIPRILSLLLQKSTE